ncbi:MAG: ChbG/HpnK family deacetylase [Bacteroidota bacterium]|nr:ChbG/HpnK family deacetylase [Bacteroidota bacterium]
MKTIAICWFVLGSLLVYSQNNKSNEIRLIVQADDIGFCHAVNNACIDSYKNGICRSVEIIVPSPWFMEAVSMLKENPGFDVGIHLCLTSEWSGLKWRPLTDGKSIRNPDGYFCPFIWPNDNFPKNAGNFLLENNPKIEEVEKEFRAQIELAKKYIPRLSHITGHMGCTNATPEIKTLTEKLAKEYGLFFGKMDTKYSDVPWSGQDKSPEQKEELFIKFLESTQIGNTYYVIEHPGYDTDEMKNIGHNGYDKVGYDRGGVTFVYTSAKVKEVIKRKNIRLLSVKEANELEKK